MKIKFEIDIKTEELESILTTAYEGGIGYWLRGLNHKRTAEGYEWVAGYITDEACEATGLDVFYTYSEVDDAVETGEAPESVVLIDHDVIALGIQRIVSGEVGIRGDLLRQVMTLTTEDVDIDADAADCIVQAGVFGELVYG